MSTSNRSDDINQSCYIVRLISGGDSGSPYRFPQGDGTSGQFISTNGSGVLSFTTGGTGNVTGPGSSTNNAIATYSGTTGQVIQNTTTTLTTGGALTITALTVGALTYPATDGTNGQAITTNGSGVLSFTTIGNVVGPASATNNAIATYNGTTGKIIQNTSTTLTTGGALTVVSLVAANLTYPTSDGSSNQFLRTNGSGVLSFATPAGGGNVSGPGSSTNMFIPVWNGGTGTLLQNTLASINTTTGVLTLSNGIGGVTYPAADGSAGQFLGSTGSGTLSFIYAVTGPGSSTNNAIVLWNSTTGRVVKSTSLTMPSTDNSIDGQVLMTNGSNSLSFKDPVSNNIVYGSITSGQTTNLSAGDHIKFNGKDFSAGTSIDLDISTSYTTTPGAASIGRISLASGGRYRLEAWVQQFTGTALKVAWYNATANTYINGPTAGNFDGCIATYFASSAVLVEVRIVSATSVTNINNVWVGVTRLNTQ